jgi:hypothetical protein
VTGTAVPVGNVECSAKEGGVKYTSASGTNAICNGAKGREGSPWTAGGTLPEGKTETGEWTSPAVEHTTGAPFLTAISFPIPLASPLGESNVHILFHPRSQSSCASLKEPSEKQECEEAREAEEKHLEAEEAFCPGTTEEPKADTGNLCVYVGREGAGIPEGVLRASFEPGADVSGALILLGNPIGTLHGTWAVTA